MEKIKVWLKNNKREFIILTLILLIGAFFRLYKIADYMTFLGDEGRDVIIVRRLLVERHPPLIGPGTSIGNMYLGPIYYYMMAPALLIANFSPVGPAVMVALLGIVTIGFIWWIGREWFPSTRDARSGQVEWGALTVAALYAISPTVIIYSRSSWNPNIMPFFALLSIYSIWKVWKHHEFNWLIVLGISFAFVLQSHYLGLLLLPVIGLFWFLTIRDLKSIGNFAKKSLIALGFFAILMSPLLFFDLRHNFQNFKAMKEFVIQSNTSFSSPIGGLKRFADTFVLTDTRLIGGRIQTAGVATSVIFAVFIVWSLVNFKKSKLPSTYYLLLIWFFVGIFGLSTYKGDVFDHYMGFIFPAPFLLLGGIFQLVSNSNSRVSKIFLIFTFSFLILVNLQNSPLRYPPNHQLQNSIEVAAFIRDKASGQRFNLATISDNNNRDVYQYFLLNWGAKVVDTDPNAVFYTVTDQLFVVCDKPKEKCDPAHDPSAWITNFGWSKISASWQVAGVNIYKLAHSK